MLAALRSWVVLPASMLAAAAGASYLAIGSEVNGGFTAGADAPPAALNPGEFRSFKLTEKEKLTHNTYRLRFAFPDASSIAGLSVASCLVTKVALPGREKPEVVVRPYTPVSPPEARGHMDLVVKAYSDGKMSKHMCNLQVGQELEFKGPFPKYPYQPNCKRQIGMVAGGTGITPMLQVIDAIAANPADNTQVTLVFANVAPADIILKDRLDALAAAHPNVSVVYVVDRAPAGSGWVGPTGHVTADLLAKTMPPPGPDSCVMVCGPPGMMAAVSGDKGPKGSQGTVSGLLKQLGYSEDHVYKF